MKIAVIGPAAGRDTLIPMIARYSESICAEAEITAADDLDLLPSGSWDLSFIYTSETGFDAYLAFVSANPDCEVVLWAEDDRLARVGLRSHARDFLLLPTGDQQFLTVMKKCQSWTDALHSIICSSNRRIRCVEIQYVESVGHTCTVHCADGVFTINRGLSELHLLLGSGFVRCHRGFVVNMRCVTEIREKSLFVGSGDEIPLSPTQAAKIADEVRTYTQELACFLRGGYAT